MSNTIRFTTAGALDETDVGKGVWLPTIRTDGAGVLLEIHHETVDYAGRYPVEEVAVLRIGVARYHSATYGVVFNNRQQVTRLSTPVARFNPDDYIEKDDDDDWRPPNSAKRITRWNTRDERTVGFWQMCDRVEPLPDYRNADWVAATGLGDDDGDF
jgi:hypothetical protein